MKNSLRETSEYKVYLFGAGFYSKMVAIWYLQNHERIDAVVVSEMNDNPESYMGLQVIPLADVIAEKTEAVFILGVTEKYQEEVISKLEAEGFHSIIVPRSPLDIDYMCIPNEVKEAYVAEWYLSVTGKKLNWKNLQTYNEKLQWLKLYDRVREKTNLTDKYEVRRFVEARIGKKYLVPLLGVWDRFDDISFDKLPDSFVLKCNHGSAWNVIVRDKNKMDVRTVKDKFDRWMTLSYCNSHGMELQYLDIKPKIIAEQLLKIEGSTDVPDYKLFVFHGEVKLIQVDIDRSIHHRRNIYTTNWEYVPVEICYPTAPEVILPKPKRLDEMIYVAKELAKDFIHVRVDLYEVGERVYFGEMTFSHGSGQEKFTPEEFGLKMGNWIELPNGR